MHVLTIALLLALIPASLFFCALAIANLWIVISTQKNIAKNAQNASFADVILVLGAPVPNELRPGPVVEDRLQSALTLFLLKKAPVVVVSGRSDVESAREVAVMERWLIENGVPRSAIIVDGSAFRTIYSAINLTKLNPLPQRVLVTTQKFHLPRSIFLLKRQGFLVEGVAADSRIYQDRRKFIFRETLGRLRACYEFFTIHSSNFASRSKL